MEKALCPLYRSRRPHIKRRSLFLVRLSHIKLSSFESPCLCHLPVSILSSLTLSLVQPYWSPLVSGKYHTSGFLHLLLTSAWNHPYPGKSFSCCRSQLKSHFLKEALPYPLDCMGSPCALRALHFSLSFGTLITIVGLHVQHLSSLYCKCGTVCIPIVQ